jgi:uncharacterized protein (DUF2252 family)
MCPFGVDGRSPLDLLEDQGSTRLQELLPIRHGRMLVSPFAYYRGAALPMAADLARTPTSSLKVQLAGDAHLSNFGVFGSPERHLFFDVNDFDETAPGPWEWDVKRLATSLEVAARDNGYPRQRRDDIVYSTVRAYRQAMRHFSQMPMLDVWYAHLDMDTLLPEYHAVLSPKRTPSVWRAISKARAHDSHQVFSKLISADGNEPRISSDPPLVIPIEDFGVDLHTPSVAEWLSKVIESYRDTLEPHCRHLLDHYRVVHLARKVVGVGSVGTDVWIALFIDHGYRTPLFLQVKEAEGSVLERYTSPSSYPNHGQRVVVGQRLMQAAGDIFLGWVRFTRNGQERDYYVRQLRDWKGSADIAGMTAMGMKLWGQMCGWTLARGHARTGDRIAIASYMGRSDAFVSALVEFSRQYADQNERDFSAFQRAVRKGRFVAELGV